MLVIFVFVSDVIFDICGKVGCYMNILLNVCAWLRGYVVSIDCGGFSGLFLSDCWNILGILASFGVFMIFLYMLILEDSWQVWLWHSLRWCINDKYPQRLILKIWGCNQLFMLWCIVLSHPPLEVTGVTIHCLRCLQHERFLKLWNPFLDLVLFAQSEKRIPLWSPS